MLEKFNTICIKKKKKPHASISRHDRGQVESKKATLISENYQKCPFLVSLFSAIFGKECTESLKIVLDDLLLLESLLPYNSIRNLQAKLH